MADIASAVVPALFDFGRLHLGKSMFSCGGWAVQSRLHGCCSSCGAQGPGAPIQLDRGLSLTIQPAFLQPLDRGRSAAIGQDQVNLPAKALVQNRKPRAALSSPAAKLGAMTKSNLHSNLQAFVASIPVSRWLGASRCLELLQLKSLLLIRFAGRLFI